MATVELLIFVDFATYTLFGADIARIAEYKALFIKGVSSIFATNADPTVTLQIVTMIVITVWAEILEVQIFYQNFLKKDSRLILSTVLPVSRRPTVRRK